MGLMQALISVFLDDDDKLRYIVAGRMHISFLLRSPLYLVCVSSWGEPESVVSIRVLYEMMDGHLSHAGPGRYDRIWNICISKF